MWKSVRATSRRYAKDRRRKNPIIITYVSGKKSAVWKDVLEYLDNMLKNNEMMLFSALCVTCQKA